MRHGAGGGRVNHLIVWASLWAIAALLVGVLGGPDHIFTICILASQIYTAALCVVKEQS